MSLTELYAERFEGVKRSEAASVYADAIEQENARAEPIDWKTINAIISRRFGTGGRNAIKRQAWRKLRH